MNKLPLFLNKNTLLSARNLSIFAVVCIVSVSVTYWLAAGRISQQITDATLRQFLALSVSSHVSHKIFFKREGFSRLAVSEIVTPYTIYAIICLSH